MKHTKTAKKRIVMAALVMAILMSIPVSATCQAKNKKADAVTVNDLSTQFEDFIKIKNDLYYDPSTKIVWMRYTTYGFCKGYTPYVAPDGLPYKYDPDSQTFHTVTSEKEAAETGMTDL